MAGSGVSLGADGVEQVLPGVGQFLDMMKREAAGGALERVDDAEDVVERFLVRLVLLQRENRAVVAIESFETLREHVAHELLLEVGAHAALETFEGNTRATTARSCGGWKGFTIQPVAPAARARFLASGSDSVVSSRIGVVR